MSLFVALCIASPLPAPQSDAPSFERVRLSETFFSEGASFADLDRDGHHDVVSGPYWYAGPEFTDRHEIYAPQPFDPVHYSDAFFSFPHDLDGDGWTDVLVVGFPGKEARAYYNPGDEVGHWRMRVVVPFVDNESPTFQDLTGDGEPELIFHTGGRLGWASPNPDDPESNWAFHALSPNRGLPQFTHGLGIGDVDGDGRTDLLEKSGWWRQPESLEGDPLWERHDYVFTPHGGAQMHVFDVDGDGDNDVVTSLAAHAFGLAWFEHRVVDGAITFEPHTILGSRIDEGLDGVQIGELHAVDVADVNGDGLLDIVTGKRWWSHGAAGDPQPGSRAVVYWFELVREDGGARFVPHLVDDDSGVGTQVVTGDVDGDGRVDVVVGNKRGTAVLLQKAPGEERSARTVAREALARAEEGVLPTADDGRPLNLDFETGDLTDWSAEGEAFLMQPIRGDSPAARNRESSRHQGEYWIGGYERLLDGPVGTLRSVAFEVTHPWASFLIGGGSHTDTALRVVREADGHLLYRYSGVNSETMQRAAIDLRALAGQRIHLELVDRQSGGWGHVNFDDFRFHDHEPHVARPQGLPEALPLDEVEHAGLRPEQAVAAMDLPAGFQVELVAAEPDLHQPVAFAIDAKNRIWVAEAFAYPTRRPDDEARDTLAVFEDADGDGRYETRTVFADDLNLISGFEVGFGGVWVGAAPYLLFIPDADDDLVPDGPPEILLDGWGYQDTHETLNAFNWGPDGWLYGCHGVFTHSRVGKPGTPDREREPINAGVWRYHPTRHEFEVFAWGSSNPWGVDFDARGQAFITACVIPHLFHVSQGGRYLRQAGSHFNPNVFEDIGTIADHRHYHGDTPHGGNLRSDSAGGGHAHCGAMIYLGDSFPDEYRGAIFMNNIHGNRVNMDLLERDGSGFVGRHGDDFLVSNDRWFRGINLKSGPNGSVYLIDWYDEQACHWTQNERWDRTNGRLYRVSYGEHEPVAVDLRERSSRELVELQLHPNDWYVDGARLVLQERGPNPAVHAHIAQLLEEVHDEVPRLRLVWALHVTGGITPERSLALLSDEHEYVRAWAVQLACESGPPTVEQSTRLARMAANDPSPVVRLYLASALQRLGPDQAWPIAEQLAMHGEDEDDPNVPLVLWYGVEPLVTARPDDALALAGRSRIDRLGRFIVRRAANDRACLDALVQALAAEDDADRRSWMLDEMSRALEDELRFEMPASWPGAYARLARDERAEVREKALWLAVTFGDSTAFPDLRATLADASLGTERRQRALDALVRGRDAESVELLHEVVAQRSPMRRPALRALASFDSPETAARLLALYPRFDLEEARDAISTLAARPSWAAELLAAVERGDVERSDVDAFTLRTLESHREPALDAAIGALWVRRPTAEAAATRIAELTAQLDGDALAGADLPNGRMLFTKNCAQCHTLFGTGGDVGPELTGSNRADLGYLLSNLVDPNAVIGKDYQVTNAWMLDGRVVSGIERARTETAVTLHSQYGSTVVPLDEVDELLLSDLSTMPEGLLDALQPDEIRDLVAYLQSPTQVSIVATAANVDAFFDGASLAGWTGDTSVWRVENSEVVGATAGLADNTWLRSDLELGDFRLALDVKLSGNAGNSGIQFRSTSDASGVVSGYQADIGAGWWGKLYEEHGRGLLWGEPGDQHVVHDGWNRYVIEARGHRLRTWINGEPCVDLEDPEGALRGIVALQIHSGGPTEVRFRKFELELDPR